MTTYKYTYYVTVAQKGQYKQIFQGRSKARAVEVAQQADASLLYDKVELSRLTVQCQK